MHPFWVTILCGLWSGSIIGPYFFENKNGATITVNGDSVHTMTTDLFVVTVHGIDMNDVWFHRSLETIDLLRQTFDGR